VGRASESFEHRYSRKRRWHRKRPRVDHHWGIAPRGKGGTAHQMCGEAFERVPVGYVKLVQVAPWDGLKVSGRQIITPRQRISGQSWVQQAEPTTQHHLLPRCGPLNNSLRGLP